MKIYKGFLIIFIFFILVGCQNKNKLVEQPINENNSIDKTEEISIEQTAQNIKTKTQVES